MRERGDPVEREPSPPSRGVTSRQGRKDSPEGYRSVPKPSRTLSFTRHIPHVRLLETLHSIIDVKLI